MTEKEVFSSENVIPNVATEGKKNANVPNLRFLPFSDEWTKVSIGSVSLPLEYGMNAAAKEYDGTHKYIRITDINDETNKYIGQPIVSPDGQLDDKYIVSEDDILFARTGASTGKTYLYNKADGLLYYAGFLIRAHIKPEYNSYFVFSQTLTSKYRNWVKLMSMRSGQPGINSQEFSGFSFYTPTLDEQVKISTFLTLIDQRIDTQSKIIEKLQSQMKSICDKIFYNIKGTTCTLNDILVEKNERTTVTNQYPVLSSTVKGLFLQSEYFSKSIASENNCGYKVVRLGNIIISPQNLWLGNITYNEKFEIGIVSPSYKVFEIAPRFDEYFIAYLLKTKRALNLFMCVSEQGASVVRRNLNMDLFGQINFVIPPYEIQKEIGSFLKKLDQKISLEKAYLESLIRQKQYLLKNMFI